MDFVGQQLLGFFTLTLGGFCLLRLLFSLLCLFLLAGVFRHRLSLQHAFDNDRSLMSRLALLPLLTFLSLSGFLLFTQPVLFLHTLLQRLSLLVLLNNILLFACFFSGLTVSLLSQLGQPLPERLLRDGSVRFSHTTNDLTTDVQHRLFGHGGVFAQCQLLIGNLSFSTAFLPTINPVLKLLFAVKELLVLAIVSECFVGADQVPAFVQ